MLDIKFLEEARLARMKEAIRQARIRVLKRELAGAQRRAFRPLEREIKASALRMLPKRGGYARIMAAAVKVSTRHVGLRYYVVIYARGRNELRDVRKVNAGFLRHPVFGHRRRKWATTGVPPGFVMIPVRKLGDQLAQESLDALQRTIVEIARV